MCYFIYLIEKCCQKKGAKHPLQLRKCVRQCGLQSIRSHATDDWGHRCPDSSMVLKTITIQSRRMIIHPECSTCNAVDKAVESTKMEIEQIEKSMIDDHKNFQEAESQMQKVRTRRSKQLAARSKECLAGEEEDWNAHMTATTRILKEKGERIAELKVEIGKLPKEVAVKCNDPLYDNAARQFKLNHVYLGSLPDTAEKQATIEVPEHIPPVLSELKGCDVHGVLDIAKYYTKRAVRFELP